MLFYESLILFSFNFYCDLACALKRLSVKEKGSLFGGRIRGGQAFSVDAGIASICWITEDITDSLFFLGLFYFCSENLGDPKFLNYEVSPNEYKWEFYLV